ncbi:MAG: cellobiose epimerase [Chloroflexota bacterium]|nr:cellobiose epimerase [Chloroflexota bacterium]
MNKTILQSSDFQVELTGNILPFWQQRVPDPHNGGFYGALSNDLTIHNEVPRSAILCARILWTFAAAYQRLGDSSYLDSARYAYEELTGPFWDEQYGGIYWTIDLHSRPVMDRKHHYAQAFAIYSLSAYYQASGDAQALQYAQELFHLLEAHAYEPQFGGYIEGSRRDWGTLDDMRLSDKDLNCRKSMNTLLHMLEAYTGLARVWPEAAVKERLKDLLEIFLAHVIDPHSGHLRLFFDDDWHSLSNTLSFGHDIECSWLLWEAAEVLDEPALNERVRAAALRLAEAVYSDGRDSDGSLFQELGPHGINAVNKEWWSQAEGMVGFTNAHQLSGDPRYLGAAEDCWRYIQDKLIDPKYGDWIKRIRPDGSVDTDSFKVGPWECPYHHARLCLEMMARLQKPVPSSST